MSYGRNVPIVLFSSQTANEAHIRMAEVGATGVMDKKTKPKRCCRGVMQLIGK